METLDSLKARRERAEISVELLEARCDTLQRQAGLPRRYQHGWRGTPGPEMDIDYGSYSDDDIGREKQLADMAEIRRDWLRERSAELEAAAERKRQGYEAATHGIARFLGEGKFGLNRLLDVTRSDSESLEAIRAERRERITKAHKEHVKDVQDRVAQRARER